MSAKRVLIVPMRWPLAERLRADGHEVVEADTAEDAVERADAGVDAVLLDARMPNEAALAVLAGVRDRDPDPPVILLAGREDAAMVTTALAGGAFDYAYEPIDPDDIARRMVRAFEVTRLRRELRTLRDRLARPFTPTSLIGVSPAMERVRALARKVANSDDAPVLFIGARGTGRDHVARVIHYSGGRAMRPFLKVPCAAMSEETLEAELFGREPQMGEVGAHARGIFDEAHEGTILLDDVDMLPPLVQGRLLGYLESREFRRVGGSTDIRVDVRIMAASTRSIDAMVQRGAFPSICSIASTCLASRCRRWPRIARTSSASRVTSSIRIVARVGSTSASCRRPPRPRWSRTTGPAMSMNSARSSIAPSCSRRDTSSSPAISADSAASLSRRTRPIRSACRTMVAGSTMSSGVW